MGNATKIQIASKEALERLIGGDTELEIELRKSVAENFAKGYMKSLFNNELTKAATTTAIKAIHDEFLDEIKTKNNYGTTIVKHVLKAEVGDFLKAFIHQEFKELLREIVIDVTNRNELREKSLKLIEEQSAYIANEWTSENIERRIELAADKKIKEKLNLK